MGRVVSVRENEGNLNLFRQIESILCYCEVFDNHTHVEIVLIDTLIITDGIIYTINVPL